MREHPLVQKLKDDLQAIHGDWQKAAHDENMRLDPSFLEQFATDIIVLDQDASSARRISACKQTASMVQHLLTTPWGAPFISDKTLLEAAKEFKESPEIPSTFFQMVENFAKFEATFESQIFDVLEEIQAS